MLMQTILGSWDRTGAIGRNGASKLAQQMSEFECAHSFMTFNTCYKDTGLFGIYLTADDNKLDDCMWYTLDNLVRLCHNVSDEEVDRAKTQLKANMLLQIDSFSQTAEDIGRQMLTYGRRMSPAETFQRIDALSTADVKATANKFINDETMSSPPLGLSSSYPITTDPQTLPLVSLLGLVFVIIQQRSTNCTKVYISFLNSTLGFAEGREPLFYPLCRNQYPQLYYYDLVHDFGFKLLLLLLPPPA